MALPKITPTHEAIEEIDRSIKILMKTKAVLISTLPVQKKRKLKASERFLVNPQTGEKGYF